ncbi:MAG: D-glycero-beta-D-manno-heptose 1-phosphate adenylyltransferase [Gemmatimonadaceae bacterium]
MVEGRSVRAPASKIMTWSAAREWRDSVKGDVVFTNGVFDLLHHGHIDVINEARRQGAALIVGINSDESVRRLKGAERPRTTAPDRAYVLAALEAVDAVVVFEEDTPLEVVEKLQPDVIVKGGDYSAQTIVGADVVRARNGRVVVVPLVPGHSTTSIIEKLRAGI